MTGPRGDAGRIPVRPPPRGPAGPAASPPRASTLPPASPRKPEPRAEDDAEERKVAVRKLRDKASRWRGQLRDGFNALNSDIDFDLRRRMQNVRTAAENAVEATDPGPGWEKITDWLRGELAKEVQANHEFAVRSIRSLSVRGAKALGLDESQVVDPPAARVPDHISVSLRELPKPPHQTGIGSLVMTIVLRAYVGFVIFFVIKNSIGVDLNVLIGIAPALVLGGIALQEERNRRTTARRVTANQVLRNYISEFGMYATKESRDLLREQEQELRDGYEALVDRRVAQLNRG